MTIRFSDPRWWVVVLTLFLSAAGSSELRAQEGEAVFRVPSCDGCVWVCPGQGR